MKGSEMGRPRFIELGSGLRVEYLKTRRLLRFSSETERRSGGFELGLHQFCDDLGIDRGELGSPAAYLLFGGGRGANGGTRDIIGTWDSEDEAREAFRRCREESSFQWAELVAMRVGGDCHPIGWFGLERGPADGERRGLDRLSVREGPWGGTRLLRALRRSRRRSWWASGLAHDGSR